MAGSTFTSTVPDMVPAGGTDSYSQLDFDASKELQQKAHASLFSIEDSTFQFALANYCFHFFIHDKLESLSSEPWYEFFVWELASEGGISNAGADFDVSADLLTDETKLPFLVTNALIFHNDGVGDPVDNTSMGLIGGRSAQEIAFQPMQLKGSLVYSKVVSQGNTGVFRVFNEFVENILNDVVDRAKRVSDDDLPFYYLPAGAAARVTRAGGLDYRSFMLMCFKLFRQLFIKHTTSAGTGDNTVPRFTNIPNASLFSETDPSPTWGTSFLADGQFTLFIPSQFSQRKSNALAACDALEPTTTFTAFSDAREATDEQLKRLITGLSHLGVIKRGYKEARISLGELTVGSNSNPLIKEFFPKGETARSEIGKTFFSRFGEGHLANVYKNIERKLPKIGITGDSSSAVALLPYYEKMMGPGGPQDSNFGRFNALQNLLSNTPSLTTSPDNIFDPSNAKILCLGLPATSVRKLHETAENLSNASIVEGSTSDGTLPNLFLRDNSLIKAKITKVDSLLPDIEYKDLEFYFDPRLYVAADGFDEVDSTPLEEQLSRVKFKRAVTSDDGSVEVQDVQLDEGSGQFIGGGSIQNASPEVAKQLAYVTLTSDLMCLYNSLISGLELGESAYHIDDNDSNLLRQTVDKNLLSEKPSPIPANEVITSLPGLGITSVVQDSSILNNMIEAAPVEYGNNALLLLKQLYELTNENPDEAPSQLVQTQQFLSSLFFKPLSQRTDIIFPRRFDGVTFCFVDPDMFVIENFGTDDVDRQSDRETVLLASGLLNQPDGEGEDAPKYIIKTGGNEDAAGIIELTVQFEVASWVDTVNSSCQPPHPYCSIIG